MAWPRAQLTQPVTVQEQLEQFALWVDAQFSQPRGGRTELAESVQKLWQHVLEAGDDPMVVICCAGEKPRGDSSPQAQAKTPIVDRDWTVALVYGHGFRNLLQGEDGQPAGKENLNDSVDALRDKVRAMTGVSEEFPVRYGGWEPFPPIMQKNANVFVAGALLRFGTTNFLKEISRTAAT